MKEKGFCRILSKYIWQYRYTVLFFLIFVGTFVGIFSLYDLEIEAVLYGAVICLVIALVTGIVHFYKYYNKHKQLQRLCRNVTLLLDELPVPQNLLEQDYQQQLIALSDIRRTELSQWEASRRDSVDFYSAWVHQIKAPIASMRLMIQSQDTKENQELLSELFRIEQYTEMVLGYSRLEATATDFVFRESPLDPIIRGIIRKYASQFIRKRIRLVYEGTDEVVLTDEKWLSFLLEQIISNAIKYTEDGVITIAVDNNQILSISDTGIGITEEDLPRIFEKGFTGYNGRADKKATGLGLYLCKQAADKLAHKVWAESKVGTGSRFFIALKADVLNVKD